MIGEDQTHHRLDHGDSAGQHARIVSALGFEHGRLAFLINGLLSLGDGGRRLEGGAQHDGFPVGDAPLDATRAIRCRSRTSVGVGDERVVVLDPGHARSLEPAPDFETLGCGERHQRAGQIGFELVEDGLAEARGHASSHALHQPAQGIAPPPGGVDALGHLGGGGGIRAAHGVGFDGFEADGDGIYLRLDLMHPANPRQHFDAGRECQKLSGNRASGHASHRFARAGSTASLPVANSVLRVGREVGVGRPIHLLHRLVGLGTSVSVANDQRDGRADGVSLEQPRENLDFVGLLTRRGEVALTRSPSVEIALDLFDRDREARGTTVHHHTHSPTVTLAEGGDLKDLSEDAGHGIGG